MENEYANVWVHRLKWAYLLLIVVTLMSPVLYIMYISFNEYGFGANRYSFTWEWYWLIFGDRILLQALKWTMLLAVSTTVIAVPLSLIADKYYRSTRNKLLPIFLLMSPLFVAPDIMGSALLVYFKNLNRVFSWIGEQLGTAMFDAWFDLGFMTTLIGLIIYTVPYSFIVIIITMGRYHDQQTEAARACGASGWQAFRDIEFPQIRAGVFSACAFTVILCFNEYTRSSLLKGGFDTFTTVLISEMLNTGMSEQSYAMSSLVSFVAIAIIGSIIIFTMIRADAMTRQARLKENPVGS